MLRITELRFDSSPGDRLLFTCLREMETGRKLSCHQRIMVLIIRPS